MNKELRRKKVTELTYGNFFIAWINENYGYGYSPIVNDEENSDVDVFGVSPKKDKLNLQMVTSNGETLKLAKQNSRKISTGGEFEAMPVNLDGWLKKAISDKNKKHYSSPTELIIIIEGFMPTPSPEEVRKSLNMNQETQFKGIYYVSLPVVSSTNLDYEKEGYVVTIKSAFDSNGDTR